MNAFENVLILRKRDIPHSQAKSSHNLRFFSTDLLARSDPKIWKALLRVAGRFCLDTRKLVIKF